MQRRVRTALLDSDPDTNDAPLRRMGGATYAGIMIAILVLAGAGIFGIIDRGGSTAWKKPGTLIVERESGTLYVYVHKVLYEVQNKTSAQLILGHQPQPTRRRAQLPARDPARRHRRHPRGAARGAGGQVDRRGDLVGLHGR